MTRADGVEGTVLAEDGCRLWTEQTGQGRPLIMCHGGPGLWDMFGSLAASLAAAPAASPAASLATSPAASPAAAPDGGGSRGGVRVIRWDQRGCGRSQRRGPYSVARSVADLDAVRAGLGLGRAAVLGHSWGASLALRYALDHPERVSALIYVSGTGLGWAWPEPFHRAAAERLAGREPRLSELRARDGQRTEAGDTEAEDTEADDSEAEDTEAEDTEADDSEAGKTEADDTEADDRELAVLQWSAEFTGPDAVRHAAQMATPWFGRNRECYDAIWGEMRKTWREPELTAECRALTTPVLIIDGAEDLRPRRAVDSLEQALPNVTRLIIPGTGHLPWLEAPAEFTRLVLGFLPG